MRNTQHSKMTHRDKRVGCLGAVAEARCTTVDDINFAYEF